MKKSLFLEDVNLQRFAEEEDTQDTEQTGQNTGDTEPETNSGDNDDITDDELITLTKAEYSEKMKSRLKRQEEKLRKEFEEQRAEEIRKSKLSQAEKEAEERQELQDELEALRESNRLMKLENETSKMLEKEGIPQKFMKFLMGKDSESTEENIANFKEQYQADIKNAKEEKWKGEAPDAIPENMSSEDHAFKVATENFKK